MLIQKDSTCRVHRSEMRNAYLLIAVGEDGKEYFYSESFYMLQDAMQYADLVEARGNFVSYPAGAWHPFVRGGIN